MENSGYVDVTRYNFSINNLYYLNINLSNIIHRTCNIKLMGKIFIKHLYFFYLLNSKMN